MNPVNEFEMFDERPLEAGQDDDFSVEDFLKQLEAREKDLHISSDLDIEIEDTDFDTVPEFVLEELAIESSPSREIELHTPSTVDPVSAAELQRLKLQVTTLEADLVRKEAARFEIAEMLKRRQTDFENLKKRVERDREEAYAETVVSVVKELFPVLDNMRHALDFAGPLVSGRSEEFRQFHEGIVLVNRQIVDVLREMGVEEIASVGEVFDPEVHEAVAVEASAEFGANVVMEELRRGYRVGNRVVRAAMVKVACEPKEESFELVSGVESADEDILDLGDSGSLS